MPFTGGVKAKTSGGFSGGTEEGFGAKLSGFAVSTLESVPELFGIKPSESTESFRARHPVAGFASQMVGAFVPYVGASKLLEAAPLTRGLIKGAEALGGESAFLRGAMKWGTEAAIIETGRVGVAMTPVPEMVFGKERDQSFGELMGGAALNVVGGAALGGVGGALVSKFTKPLRFDDAIPGMATDNPLHVRLNAADEALKADAEVKLIDPNAGLTPDFLTRLTREREKLITYQLGDTLPDYSSSTGEAMPATGTGGRPLLGTDKGKYFRPLEDDKPNPKGGSQTTNFLNRINIPKSTELVDQLRPVFDPEGRRGFRSQDDLASFFERVAPRETLALNAQNVTFIKVKEGKGTVPAPNLNDPLVLHEMLTAPEPRLLSSPPVYGKRPIGSADMRAKTIENHFTKKAFKYVGDDLYMAKEKETGFYVFSKKIKGEVGAPKAGDEWATWRTHKPEVFNPRAVVVQEELKRSGFWAAKQEVDAPIGERLYDSALHFEQTFGGKAAELLNEKAPMGKGGAAVRDLVNQAGNILSPTAPGATRKFKMNYAIQMIKELEANVNDAVDTLMRGARDINADKSIGRQVLEFDPPTTAGVQDAVKTLARQDLIDIQEVLESEIPFDVLGKMYHMPDVNGKPLLSEEAFGVLTSLQAISDTTAARIGTLSKHVGKSAENLLVQFQTRNGHYGLTRETPYPYRMRLIDEDGNLKGIASGPDPASAQRFANDLIDRQAKKGMTLFSDGLIDETQLTPEVIQGIKAAIRKPGFLKSRGGLLGYELQRSELTHDSFIGLIERNLKRRENWIRDIVANERLGPIIDDLRRESPADAAFIQKRMDILQGKQGDFEKAQNKLMDTALHAVGFSGKDTASGIVRATQQLLSTLQFNFLQVSNPVLNIVGMMQTYLPEIAWGLNVSPEMMAKHYVSAPMFTKDGLVGSSVGFLSPWKLLGNALKDVSTPFGQLEPAHQNLIRQMVREGAITGQFAEEQFGATGSILAHPREAFQDGKSFVKFIGAANQVLMTKSEELNRIIGVNSAYQMAKLIGIPEDRLATFTREFLGKTAFNYSTIDRATAFTTPVGSLMGTFKNWVFHYMANMVKYATGGKEALPALFWQTASTALIGGAAATPFIIPVADGVSKFLTDKTAMQNLYEGLGGMGIDERVSDGVMYGLPGAMGLSLSSQVQSPGADPERDAQMMFSFAVWDRMKGLSTATKDAFDVYKVTGESPFEDAQVRGEFIRALAPRTIYRAMAAMQDESIKSLATNYKVLEGVGPMDAFLYSIGFNPTQLDKTYQAYGEIRNSQQKKKEAVQQFGQTLAQAWEEGDDRAATGVFTRAMAMGLDTSSVIRSAQARTARLEETQLNFTAGDEDREEWAFAFPEEDVGF